MKEQNLFVVSENISWEAAGEGIRRKILAYDKKLMLVRVEFKKNSVGAMSPALPQPGVQY